MKCAARQTLGLLGLMAAAATSGCKMEALPADTEFVLEVHSNLAVPDEMDAIRVYATRADGAFMYDRTEQLDLGPGQARLPIRITLVPLAARSEAFLVWVDGLRSGQLVVAREILTSFVPERSWLRSILLARACVGVICPAGKTCGDEGVCVEEQIAPNFAPEPPPDAWSSVVAAPRRDGGLAVVDVGGVGGDGAVTNIDSEARVDGASGGVDNAVTSGDTTPDIPFVTDVPPEVVVTADLRPDLTDPVPDRPADAVPAPDVPMGGDAGLDAPSVDDAPPDVVTLVDLQPDSTDASPDGQVDAALAPEVEADTLLAPALDASPDRGAEASATPDAGAPPPCSTEGAPCDDLDPTTLADTCAAGVCAGWRIEEQYSAVAAVGVDPLTYFGGPMMASPTGSSLLTRAKNLVADNTVQEHADITLSRSISATANKVKLRLLAATELGGSTTWCATHLNAWFADALGQSTAVTQILHSYESTAVAFDVPAAGETGRDCRTWNGVELDVPKTLDATSLRLYLQTQAHCWYTAFGWRALEVNLDGFEVTDTTFASSPWTTENCVPPLGCPSSAGIPAAPTGPAATLAAGSAVDVGGRAISAIPSLTWADNSAGERQFVLERLGDEGIFQEVGLFPCGTTAGQDLFALLGRSYDYRLAARNAAGQSAYTPVFSASPPHYPWNSLAATTTLEDFDSGWPQAEWTLTQTGLVANIATSALWHHAGGNALVLEAKNAPLSVAEASVTRALPMGTKALRLRAICDADWDRPVNQSHLWTWGGGFVTLASGAYNVRTYLCESARYYVDFVYGAYVDREIGSDGREWKTFLVRVPDGFDPSATTVTIGSKTSGWDSSSWWTHMTVRVDSVETTATGF
jgi:hypothetical protein